MNSWIDHIAGQMLVGNRNDQFSGTECQQVLQELIRRANLGEQLIPELGSEPSKNSHNPKLTQRYPASSVAAESICA